MDRKRPILYVLTHTLMAMGTTSCICRWIEMSAFGILKPFEVSLYADDPDQYLFGSI